MFLNATLLVQIVHFFIAYCILDYILLRPVVTRIFKEKNDLDRLYKNNVEARKKLDSYLDLKNQEITITQQQFAAYIPSVAKEKAVARHLENIPSCQTVEYADRKEALVLMVVHKVQHVS